MCDSVSSTPIAFSAVEVGKSWLIGCNLRRCRSNVHGSSVRNGRLKLVSTGAGRSSGVLGSGENKFRGELGLKEKREEHFKLESSIGKGSKVRNDGGTDFRGVDGIELKGKARTGERKEGLEEEDLVRVEDEQIGKPGLRRGRQVIRRSNMLAKQVISIQSALSLGFVSQIWVDTASWMVLVVEVRPNLLSGESERFFLQDVNRVGDVLLVEDENVMENEIKMVCLETLVGYRVLTPNRRNIGKVRGFSFNINSGAVEALELDSFGISIIPSSLVSTYALPVEDVVDVLADTVIVHEAAASRIQKLTKGLWDAQNMGTSMDELEEHSVGKSSLGSRRGRNRQRGSGSKKFCPKIGGAEDDWELPMDYL